jgi:uncharacterized protein YecE (DUF72 family)
VTLDPSADVRVGTSGWSYPSGPGAWTGVFYPPARGGRGRRDELAYYAEHFDTVEVNSSFYRTPAPGTTRRWAARTPSGFEFSLKLYQKFTHPDLFARTTGLDPYALGRADVDEFRVALDPIARAGKLGALLAQFPPSFHAVEATREYLAWLLTAFADYPVAVELRHRSWSDEAASTLALLGEHGAAWVQIDEPKFRFSIRQDFRPNVPGAYYMRLHGRNAAAWWAHGHPAERYDYLYSAAELAPVASAVAEASRAARKLRVYMNNHFEAKAVANAAVLKHQLGQPVPGEYPPEFVRRYPETDGIVTVSSRSPLLP